MARSSTVKSPRSKPTRGITINTGKSGGFMKSVVDYTKTPQGKIIVGSAATIVVGGIAYKSYKNWQRKKLLDNVGSDIHASLAAQIYHGLNPVGYGWLFWSSSANTAELYRVARQIGNEQIQYAKISAAYNTMYGRTLSNDLQRKLNSNEYNAFMAFVQSGGTVPGGVVTNPGDTNSEYVVITTRETPLRTSPEIKGWYTGTPLFSNVIGHAPAGKSIGVWTGNQQFDDEDSIVFLEIATAGNGEQELDRRAWVAQSFVDLVERSEAFANYGTQENGDIANSFYLPVWQWNVYSDWQLFGIEESKNEIQVI